MLLTFRPFLVFRAKWRQDNIIKQNEAQSTGHIKTEQTTTPPWLDEACECCLEAARCMIRNLSEACEVNNRVRVRNVTSTLLSRFQLTHGMYTGNKLSWLLS